MKPQRLAKIDHEIQRILGTLVSQELQDPRLAFVTVTRVEVTDDLRHCKVFVSVIGDRQWRGSRSTRCSTPGDSCAASSGRKIDLRHTPELIFVEDRSAERAIALAKTLREDSGRREKPA